MAPRTRTPRALDRFRAALESQESDPKISWVWIRHKKNSGKGAAIRTGLTHVDTDLVVIHDADLEYHPQDLPKMVEVFLVEEADAVFGSRFMAGGYKRALFFRHSLGNKFLTFLCDLVCDLNLTDMETCYKMVRADLLKSIPLESATFDVEPELAIKLAKRGSRIFEVAISYSGRTYREGKKIGWKDGVRAIWAIFHYALSGRIYPTDEHGAGILDRLTTAPRFTRWMADVIDPYVGDRVLEGRRRNGQHVHEPDAALAVLGDRPQSLVPGIPCDVARDATVYARSTHERDGGRDVSDGAAFRHGGLPERRGARAGRCGGAAKYPECARGWGTRCDSGAVRAMAVRHTRRSAGAFSALHGRAACAMWRSRRDFAWSRC